MLGLVYVTESWRYEPGEEPALDERGFPTERAHDHSVHNTMELALRDALDGALCLSDPDAGDVWDSRLDSIRPFAIRGHRNPVGYKIDSRSPDGHVWIHVIQPNAVIFKPDLS